MRASLVVNGRTCEVDVEARTTLADALRDRLGLTGTHLGCEQGSCGACTVLVDGERARACLLFAVQCTGREVTTVEGVGSPGDLHPVQEALHEHHGVQCGFCTPGFVTLLAGAIDAAGRDGTTLSEPDLVDLVGSNLCRCTGYRPILAAARAAARARGVYAGPAGA